MLFELLSMGASRQYSVALAKETSVNASILMGYLLYQWKQFNGREFYNTAEKITQYTGLSRKEIETATSKLDGKGLVKRRVKGSPPMAHFHFDEQCHHNLNQILMNHFYPTEQQISDDGGNQFPETDKLNSQNGQIDFPKWTITPIYKNIENKNIENKSLEDNNPQPKKPEKPITYEQWVSQGADGKTEYAPYVWLTKDEYYKIQERYGGNQELLNEMIDSLSEYKSRENPKKPSKFNYQIHFKSSYQILHHGWMYDRYLERLTILNKAKTSEIIANKVQANNNGTQPLNNQNQHPQISSAGAGHGGSAGIPAPKELMGMHAEDGLLEYNPIDMTPKPDYIIAENGDRVYLSWETLFNIPGIHDRRFPITTSPSKLRKLPENLLSAYCLFFSITIEDIGRL
jgi:hypothetical protein